ncbi:MAG: ABC transporter permease, partial [Dehalococcoidales bacterium]
MTIVAESVRPHHTLWGDAWIRLRRNRLAVTGGVLILLITLVAIIYPFFSKYDFASQDLNAILQGPSSEHLLGTDELGRDVLTRLIYGARTSLMVGIFTQIIVLGIGLPIGAISGATGGKMDNFLMRFVDVI